MTEFQPDDELDDSVAMDVLRMLLAAWWVIAICVVLAAIGGVFYALNAPRVYRAEVLMIPAGDDKNGGGMGDLSRIASQFGGIASLVGLGGGGGGTTKEVSLATLSSRGFQSSLIEDLGLMQVFYSDRWNAATAQFEPSWTGSTPTIDDAIKYFNENVFAVVEDRKTGLIRVRVEWYDREKAALWANTIVDRINKTMRSQASEEARRSLEFLNRELAQTSNVEVQRSIYSLIAAQVNRIMLSNVREQYAFRVLDPAVAPSERNAVRPRRSWIVMVATGLGFAFGCAIAVVLDWRKRRGIARQSLA